MAKLIIFDDVVRGVDLPDRAVVVGGCGLPGLGKGTDVFHRLLEQLSLRQI